LATYNSNLIAAGQGSPSILPGATKTIVGSVTVPSGVALLANDTLPLFYLGAGSAAHIVGYTIDSGAMDAGTTLTMSLLDSNTTPTTIINAVTTFRTAAVMTEGTVGHGTIGSAISYTAQSLIYLKAIAGGTGNLATAQTIYFMFHVVRD
jgi:hypothetical protein